MTNNILPMDTSCQAEYEDGFILDETQLEDKWPHLVDVQVDEFDELTGKKSGSHTEQVFKNVFYAILNRLPEANHGKMVRFSVFYKDARYDIDWTTLPENARPIRFRDGASYLGGDGRQWSEWTGMRFGYQFNDETGKNVQEVQEL